MKKIIIILIIAIFNINNIFANSFSGSTENIYQKENKILKNQIKIRDERLHQMLEDKKNYYSKLNTLKSENYQLKKELEILNKKIHSEKFKKDIIQDLIIETFNNLKNLIQSDDGKIFLILLYLSSALFLFIFFFIYTIPLRIIRAIWRKIIGYKEENCNSNFENKFKSLFKKYKSLKEEKSELTHHISELEKINSKMRFQNLNYKKELHKLENEKIRKKIEENKIKKKNNSNEDNLFIFEDKKVEITQKAENNKKNDLFFNTIPKEIEFSEPENKKEKKSFVLKKENDFFEKKKKEKFSLGGSSKGLFD